MNIKINGYLSIILSGLLLLGFTAMMGSLYHGCSDSYRAEVKSCLDSCGGSGIARAGNNDQGWTVSECLCVSPNKKVGGL